jgi:hypothetical protein
MRLRGARGRAALAGGSALAAFAALALAAPSCTDNFDAVFTHDCTTCLNEVKALCDEEGTARVLSCLYCRECKDECAGLDLCPEEPRAPMESGGGAGTGP